MGKSFSDLLDAKRALQYCNKERERLEDEIRKLQQKLATATGQDKPSPSDIVPSNSIHTLNNPKSVMVNVAQSNIPFTLPPEVWLTNVENTKSMDPTVDYLHTTILLRGIDDENQKIMVDFVKEGDVVVVRSDTFYFMHRIIKIEQDGQGRKFTTRGDHAGGREDPYDIRDEHIKYLLAGIVY